MNQGEMWPPFLGGAKVFLDAAQSVSDMRVDLQSPDGAFFFSGYKVFAPTGIG
jgi:selenocysteine lyase/cysteine desulfurase